MPMQRSQRGGSLIVRVRQQTERRALEQARRVPWKRLAEAAEEYTDWQVFTLWLRAVVEGAGNIPAMVAEEMESRTPQLLGRIRPAVEAAIKNGNGAGSRIWQDVSGWAETNVFTDAARAGWLDAVRYFSSVSLRSMKAWSHWEDIDRRWRVATPQHFPNYERWQREVCRWRRKRVPFWRRWRWLVPRRFTWSLSLLTGRLFQNGSEPSRARRCWARRSEPLPARTVLGSSRKRERLPAGTGRSGSQKVDPS